MSIGIRRTFRHRLVAAVLLTGTGLFAALGVAAEEPAMVAGTWALTVETSAGTGTPTLELVQDGATVTGTYTGRFGAQPVTGSVAGNALTFSFEVSGMMGSAVVTYQATVDGDAMQGTMSMGNAAGGSFTGVRK